MTQAKNDNIWNFVHLHGKYSTFECGKNVIVMSDTRFGKIKSLSAKSVFDDEPNDFTPWLAENIELLGNAIGVELAVTNTEVSAGVYSADILAKDVGSGNNVIIENQFGKTDHPHIGKALTYASVLNASAVIWIATKFTEEHKKTLDWLNENTLDDLEFYGIELEVFKIDESDPAIRFNVVSYPISFDRKQAKSAKDKLSKNNQLQLEFWKQFKDTLTHFTKVKSNYTPKGQYWFNVALGKTGVRISNVVHTSNNEAGVRLYLRNQVVDDLLPFLEANKEAIEQELGDLGAKLIWDAAPENRDKVIGVYKSFDITEGAAWDDTIKWMVGNNVKFRKVFSKWVKKQTKPISDNV